MLGEGTGGYDRLTFYVERERERDKFNTSGNCVFKRPGYAPAVYNYCSSDQVPTEPSSHIVCKSIRFIQA